MKQRSLSSRDIREMEETASDPNYLKSLDRRKGDRRKAINTSMEPKHDRRQHDRRNIGKK